MSILFSIAAANLIVAPLAFLKAQVNEAKGKPADDLYVTAGVCATTVILCLVTLGVAAVLEHFFIISVIRR